DGPTHAFTTHPTRPTRPTPTIGAFDVLDVAEQQSIRVLPDGGDGIDATLLVVGDVELELHVARVGRGKNLIHLLGPFANRVHVIVVPERDAEIRRSFADFGEQTSEPLI